MAKSLGLLLNCQQIQSSWLLVKCQTDYSETSAWVWTCLISMQCPCWPLVRETAEITNRRSQWEGSQKENNPTFPVLCCGIFHRLKTRELRIPPAPALLSLPSLKAILAEANPCICFQIPPPSLFASSAAETSSSSSCILSCPPPLCLEKPFSTH